MEITYKKGAPTIRLIKHNKRGSFSRILYRIAKNWLRRGHGTDLVQLTHLYLLKLDPFLHFRQNFMLMVYSLQVLGWGNQGDQSFRQLTKFTVFSLCNMYSTQGICGTKYSRMDQVTFALRKTAFKNFTWFIPEYFVPCITRVSCLMFLGNQKYMKQSFMSCGSIPFFMN